MAKKEQQPKKELPTIPMKGEGIPKRPQPRPRGWNDDLQPHYRVNTDDGGAEPMTRRAMPIKPLAEILREEFIRHMNVEPNTLLVTGSRMREIRMTGGSDVFSMDDRGNERFMGMRVIETRAYVDEAEVGYFMRDGGPGR